MMAPSTASTCNRKIAPYVLPELNARGTAMIAPIVSNVKIVINIVILYSKIRILS